MLIEAKIANTRTVIIVYGRDKNIPTLAAVAEDIKTGPYMVYLINPTKVKELRYTAGWPPVVRFINGLGNDASPEDIASRYSTVPAEVIVGKHMTKDQLRKYLSTKTKVETPYLDAYFGKEETDAVISGTEVSGLSELSAEKRKSFEGMLAQLKGTFARHGVGELSKIPLLLSPITQSTGNVTLGLFYPVQGYIRINSTRQFNDRMVQTLVHEYGHAWYFLHMTADQRQQVKEFFSSLDQSDHQASIDVKVGDFVRYIGKKHTLRAGNDYVISGHKGSLYGLVPVMGSFTHRGKEYSGFSANIGALAGGEWEKEVEVNGKREWVLIREESSSEWFPSDYSKKNHEEWWAEMFAAFMEDRLGEEQSAWIKQYLA